MSRNAVGTSRKAMFFDRDGVLNSLIADGTPTGRSPHRVDEFTILEPAREAVRLAHASGFLALIITNQPGLSRGALLPGELDAIHGALMREIPEVQGIYVCPHSGTGCGCRKPRPGLIVKAAAEHDICLADSWMIGDRWIDVAAGHAAGCKAALLDEPYAWLPNSDGAPPEGMSAEVIAVNTLDAVQQIVRRQEM